MIATPCASCGTEPREGAKYCDVCGSPLRSDVVYAEYKQVTVLFADVVHSMRIAAVVGAERMREIMSELVNCASTVVRRYGGTVKQFTGDGVMAVFGAPVALEDHAFRACLAARAIQEEANRLAKEVRRHDDVELRLRVGLNSGQVVAGEIGSAAFGYTAIGEHVGIAQRMESVAPAGGVMLSESTARLVENAAILGDPEMVEIKGGDLPVLARRLLGVSDGRDRVGRWAPSLLGRHGELDTLSDALQRAIDGHGCIIGITGSAGIGKSRLVAEVAVNAASRGVEVFSAFGESHASEIPFHAVTTLLGVASGISDLADEAARARLRAGLPDADAQDLLLLDDLLGIGDPTVPQPLMDPDERRGRLTTLVSSALLARVAPAVYVIEDAHWIDGISESMLADFIAVIPQSHALALITYRPEYRGVLAKMASRTISLAPLNSSQTGALTAELLGSHPSVVRLAEHIAERADGNPFFAQEMIREQAARGVIEGGTGRYLCRTRIGNISVPATLQATIASRIDRLAPGAKRALSAASVLGSRFDADLLDRLGVDAVLEELVSAELVDRVEATPGAEYAFRHPLIHTVAYESQLKSDRADLHRRAASAIQERGSPDEDAALIAEHLEAAGDLVSAYAWHMRAGTWRINRDISAAQMSGQRAERLARVAYERNDDLKAAELLSRALLWQGRPVEANAILARLDPDKLDEMQLVSWGIPRLSILFWSMGDVIPAHDILTLLRERVTHPRLKLIVDATGAAVAVHENAIAEGIAEAEAVLAHPQVPTAAIEFAAFAAGLAMPAAGRGRDFEPIAARCRADQKSATGMVRVMVRYCDVLALVHIGDLDRAEKRAADYAALSFAGEFLPWAITKIITGLVATYRGKFLDAISSLEPAIAVLSEEVPLPWRLPARLLLAKAYAALGRVVDAERVLGDAAEHSGQFVALHTPQLMIANSWLAAAKGSNDDAVELARAAADAARESGQYAVEAEALHHAARCGDQTVAARLEELVRLVDGEMVALQSRHAVGVATSDAPALDAVSAQFEEAGLLLSAADSAAQAAVLYADTGQRLRSQECRGHAIRLADECGGAMTPAIVRSAESHARRM
jgi:class 3 adenylate cyclase/tetratricopeptide (TPR) repeat protein